MKNNIVKWLILAFAFALGIHVGGGIYETVVVMPVWTASADIARNWNSNPNFIIDNGKFFIVATPIAGILALLLLILGWKSPSPLRFWLRMGTIIYLLVVVITIFYFVPEQFALRGHEATQGLSDAEILSRANRWVMLNNVRIVVALVVVFATLKALSLSSVLEEKDA